MTSAAPKPAWSWPGLIALVVCASMWSLSGPLIKMLHADGVSGWSIAFYRSIIGGVILIPFALRRVRTLRAVSPVWPAASVALFTLMTATFVIATTRTASANAVILQYTSPIWVLLLSPLLLGERPRAREGLVLLIAMAGVAVIFFGHTSADTPALLIALTSGFAYGALTVTLRGLRRVDPLVVTSMNCAGSGLILGAAIAISGTFVLSGKQWILVTVLSLVQFCIPYVIFAWALGRVEAHRAAIVVLLEPVLNPLWTYLVVGEPVPGPTRVGGPMILAGVLAWMLLAVPRRRGDAAAAAPSGNND
jgi:drug/metabolite transporter (DMT)-like permease